MVKGKRGKGNILILAVPLKKTEYPRIEVHLDRTGATIGLKETEDPKIQLIHASYTGTSPKHIMRLVDEAILLEKMTQYRRKDYEPTMKDFFALVKKHDNAMEKLWKENKL